MTTTVFVPCDAIALSLGADDVVAAIEQEAVRRGVEIRLVRNGSRGLFWLDPLVEVDIDGVRHGYGPVDAADVASLFDASFLSGGDHRLALGAVESIAELAAQTPHLDQDLGLFRRVVGGRAGGHVCHRSNCR
jgi:formate dehydrogenase iron-sulfur subunit